MRYVDDVVIATPTLEDHIERLDEVFACMKRSGLKCKPSKCEILKDSIKYLGRMVDKHGIRPDTDAVEAVLTWKSPKTEHQLMSFLGFANFYREFIKGYADKVYPMQQLMRHKGKKFTWNNLKSKMASPSWTRKRTKVFHSRDGWTNQANRLKIILNYLKNLQKRPS